MRMGLRVYIEEGGCDRRQLDAATIRRYLAANHYELVDDPRDADKILAVTCAFKRKEEDESVGRLRSLRKYDADVIVYGCLPDIATDRFAEFSDLPAVGPSQLETIAEHFEPDGVPFSEIPSANIIEPTGSLAVNARRRLESGTLALGDPASRIRALASRSRARQRPSVERPFHLFVCRGCTGACSYCAIKRAIKGVVSKPVADVLAELRTGLAEGHRDFHLLGDDPGCYGLDRGLTLPRLLGALFDECESHPASDGDRPIRFHIREIHPEYLVRYHEELLALPRFDLVGSILCPAQSGNDRVLGLMRRKHRASELLEAIGRIRAAHPSITFDTQLIAGFPTESAEEFEDSLRFVSEAGFSSVVVFPYDDKRNTEAATIPEKIPAATIRRRVAKALRQLRADGVDAYDSCPA